MILAGQQPDKTNAWLQLMFRAATSGIDTTPYVQEILGVGGEDDGADEQAAAEAEMARQAAEEEAAQRAAEENAKKQADNDKAAEKKKRMEEKKRKQKQMEEEERQRVEMERQEQERNQALQQEEEMLRLREEEMMRLRAQQEAELQQQQQFAVEEQQDDGGMHGGMDNFEGRGGALVEEAKALMQEADEPDTNPEAENAGPKIKMGKLGGGRRGKKPTASAADKGGDAKKLAMGGDYSKPL
mmetsp:Transcript_31112/g.47531  ORF Transcript_31112/g.47531 Transcript_31112/m.47531 type:complete len:242 (+) Transcript_31112:309-1034(+)|eukprot:CAMPEP_0170493176 /NCGR_PEP_ID=MMETSP0208-20121228/13478_1 /TAXON_ID=197538 /ORGANISM="Strombidium inclinatum, Strain S3" /LENGTH=241 /DNA_ID=CAMNT_0010769061 /DNA_START=314 /DNA_END=1039 /DNA_ORIENTATION=+